MKTKKNELIEKIVKRHIQLTTPPDYMKSDKKLYVIEFVQGATAKLIELKLWPHTDINIDGIRFFANPIDESKDQTKIDVYLVESTLTTPVPIELITIIDR
jgi:hypothetical protein